MHTQTFFEAARGISSVGVAVGQALIVVSGLEEEEAAGRRLEGLGVLRDAGLSIDFLKVAPHGFSFVMPEEGAEKAASALRGAGFDAACRSGRAVITVHAPNIRDESGLVARIAQIVVRAGAAIDHVGDMHSSVQVVVDAAHAEAAVSALEGCVGKAEVL